MGFIRVLFRYETNQYSLIRLRARKNTRVLLEQEMRMMKLSVFRVGNRVLVGLNHVVKPVADVVRALDDKVERCDRGGALWPVSEVLQRAVGRERLQTAVAEVGEREAEAEVLRAEAVQAAVLHHREQHHERILVSTIIT